jgi:hypothetical protein
MDAGVVSASELSAHSRLTTVQIQSIAWLWPAQCSIGVKTGLDTFKYSSLDNSCLVLLAVMNSPDTGLAQLAFSSLALLAEHCYHFNILFFHTQDVVTYTVYVARWASANCKSYSFHAGSYLVTEPYPCTRSSLLRLLRVSNEAFAWK